MTDTEYTNLSNWKALQHVSSILRDMSGDDVLNQVEIDTVRQQCALMHQKYNDVFDIEEESNTKQDPPTSFSIDEFKIDFIEGSFSISKDEINFDSYISSNIIEKLKNARITSMGRSKFKSASIKLPNGINIEFKIDSFTTYFNENNTASVEIIGSKVEVDGC